ncbi:MAG: VCBS repeat-containing protein [Planctomycetota bacterium]
MRNPLIEIALIVGLLAGLGGLVYYKVEAEAEYVAVPDPEPVPQDPPVEQSLAYSPFSDGLPSKGMWRGNPEVADLNGDGLPDIVCSIRNDEGLCVFLGDGQGGWTKSVEGISRTLDYGGADVADFNGDGHVDIVYTTHSTPIRVFLGDGTGGNWKELRDDFLVYDKIVGDVAAGDLNGDGNADIVGIDMFSSKEGRGVMVFLGDGKGGFSLGADVPLERNKMFGNSVDLGDFDGDGDLDFVASLRNPTVYLNNGDGTFVIHNEGLPTTTTGGSYLGTAVGDLVPGKGADEIVFAAIVKKDPKTNEVIQAGLTVWTLDEKGVWQSVSDGLPAADTFYDIDVADFDGDGKLDLVTSGFERATTIFLGDGQGRWEEIGQIEGTEGQRALVKADDFNGDGMADVFTLSQYGTGAKVWVREKGKLIRGKSRRSAAPQ